MKRPFILIEVLVSLALVGLCAYPLIFPHYQVVHRKTEAIRRLKLEQLADELFCEAQEQLYEGKLHWSKIQTVPNAKFYFNSPRSISVLGKTEWVHVDAGVIVSKKKDRPRKHYYRLFEVTITLSGKKTRDYHYFLYGYQLGKEA